MKQSSLLGAKRPEANFEILTPGAMRQNKMTPRAKRPPKNTWPSSIVPCRIVTNRIVLRRGATHRIVTYRIVPCCIVSYRIVSFRFVSCACVCVLVHQGALAFLCACVGAFACICACVCAFASTFLHRSQGPSLIFPRGLASSFPGT